MNRNGALRKLAFVGDYVPRRCGIATFTHDLCSAVALQYPGAECIVVPVNDVAAGYEYPPEVRFEIEEQNLDSYRRAADFLNFANTDVVCVQHEYGIYGGPAGSHLLGLLRDLRMPVVSTLHTVLREPSPEQHRVLRRLTELSARVVIMTEKGKSLLRDIYEVPEEKIDLIPHGIPDMPFVDPNFYKDQFGVEAKQVLMTFGLLSPNKGIEVMLRALPKIVAKFPNLIYMVLGATHPTLIREQGESYRWSLEHLAEQLGIKRNVAFYNRFVNLAELTDFLGAADVYITPYLDPQQITSGTLAYAFGCGKAVVSTPYWHAEELLGDGRGILVPFNDSDALADGVMQLLVDETRRHAMRKKAYLLGREMIWSQAAHQYMVSFQHARESRAAAPRRRLAMLTLEEQVAKLPDWRFDHLETLTDSTGILQHARYTIPNLAEGYCTDDNARALHLTVLIEELGRDDARLQRLEATYAAFVQLAFDQKTRRFRNFMRYDRNWVREDPSEDTHGRTLWALGSCVGRSQRRQLQFWAAELFEQALGASLELTSLRAWAFGLLGIYDYFRRLSGDRLVAQTRDALLGRLLDGYSRHAGPDWRWFEPTLTYDNARLPQALIQSGQEQAVIVGMQALQWLTEIQQAPGGHFRPIGSNGFYPQGGRPAQFDQQPLEAWATVSACLAAHRATGEAWCLHQAKNAFAWFLGRNDIGLPVYDATTGGCRDGLHPDRVNQNQGAESTLSFLIALAEMRLFEGSILELHANGDRPERRLVAKPR